MSAIPTPLEDDHWVNALVKRHPNVQEEQNNDQHYAYRPCDDNNFDILTSLFVIFPSSIFVDHVDYLGVQQDRVPLSEADLKFEVYEIIFH